MRLRDMLAGFCLIVGVSVAGTSGACPSGSPGFPACAHGPRNGHGPHHPGGPGHFLEQHADQLGLDEPTRESIRSLSEASRAEADALNAEIGAAREALHDLLAQEAVDEAEVMAAVENLGDLETALHRHKLQTMLRVRSLLTPEQRSELMRLRKDRHARHAQFRAQMDDTLETCAQDAENLCDARGHRALRCLHEQKHALSSECLEALEKLPPPHHCRPGKGAAGAFGCGRSGLHGPGVPGVEQGA